MLDYVPCSGPRPSSKAARGRGTRLAAGAGAGVEMNLGPSVGVAPRLGVQSIENILPPGSASLALPEPAWIRCAMTG